MAYLSRKEIVDRARELAMVEDSITEDQARGHVRELFVLLHDAYMSDYSVDQMMDIMEEVGRELDGLDFPR